MGKGFSLPPRNLTSGPPQESKGEKENGKKTAHAHYIQKNTSYPAQNTPTDPCKAARTCTSR
ncbi:hypothetical protein E2C01_080588 [Portunus trituberculatus]|uniref:Uncharacterized protein n=1 Tax=Portunus trituberculatus TaxID=210409 RepID=A0A5B7ITU5_PORTR|nr:hypothetical protein [Portunus trituberculatus]